MFLRVVLSKGESMSRTRNYRETPVSEEGICLECDSGTLTTMHLASEGCTFYRQNPHLLIVNRD